jgi:hypothetical protein
MDRTIGELPGIGGCAIFRHARDDARGRKDRIPRSCAGDVDHRPGMTRCVRLGKGSRSGAEPSFPRRSP